MIVFMMSTFLLKNFTSEEIVSKIDKNLWEIVDIGDFGFMV